MDSKAIDVGFAPANAGHYVENSGDTNVVLPELFNASEVVDFSLNHGSGAFLLKCFFTSKASLLSQWFVS
jgi:oxalate decarboxylase/phosphoglucose isomerase-like protein (cupin superfamily)